MALLSPKVRTDKAPPEVTNKLPLDFNNDVVFLMFIITHKLNLATNKLANSELEKEFILEKTIKDLITQTSYKVVTTLSESYKETLYKYWKKEELTDFIIDIVTLELTNLSIKLNNGRMDSSKKSNILSRDNDILTQFNSPAK